MQVKFKQRGCFKEKNGKLIAKGKRQGRMFILDVDMPRKITAMFAEGTSVISDVEMWHKRIGHISMQTLKNMLRKDVVDGWPKLKDCEMGKICEACQMEIKIGCVSLMKDMLVKICWNWYTRMYGDQQKMHVLVATGFM